LAYSFRERDQLEDQSPEADAQAAESFGRCNPRCRVIGAGRSVCRAQRKKLVNHAHGYRLRVGNYRVFFDFDVAIRIVSIEEVRKRDEQTY
jgi:hypothetical protein